MGRGCDGSNLDPRPLVEVLESGLGDGHPVARAGGVDDGAEDAAFLLEGAARREVELDLEGTDHRVGCYVHRPMPETDPLTPGGLSLALQTDRLVLRRWQVGDLAPFAALNSDPRVMEFFPAMLGREESDGFARRVDAEFDSNGYGLWAVEVTDDEADGDEGLGFIGFVGVHSLAGAAMPFPAEAEVGWRLARRAWGKGYAPEAARAAMADVFDRIGLAEIVSFTSIVNVRSQSVMRKIGMHRDPADDFEHPRVEAGHLLRPHVLYRLAATEFFERSDRGSR